NKIKTRTDSLLEQLRKRIPVLKPPHPWQKMADLIRKYDGIIDVTESGFSILQDDGSRLFEPPGGITEEHYRFFAPYLVGNDLEKAWLAEVVLEKMVKQEGCPEPETGLWLLRKKYDHD